MKKALFIVHKPAVQDQVGTILKRYNIDDIVVYVQSDSFRLDINTVSKWECFKEVNVKFNYLDFTKLNKNTLLTVYNKENFELIALPLIIGRVFYLNINKIKQKSKVVNLSDGTCELGSILDFHFRIEIKNVLDFLKSVIKSIERKFYLADESYSPFYPLQSCFSKRTFLANRLEIDVEKKLLFDNLTKDLDLRNFALFISGLEYSNDVISNISGINNYIATSKNMELFISGKKIELPFYLCAEDLLAFFKPNRVIGYHSDAVVYAKNIYPDIKCYVLPSKEISKVWGRYHNRTYMKQLKGLDLIQTTLDELKILLK